MKKWILLWCVLQTTSTFGQLLFQEDFSKPNLFGEGPLAYYHRGEYHILAEKGRMVYDDDHRLGDFVAEVKSEFVDGDDNRGYGLFFRALDYENCYVFCISGNGYFELGNYKKGNWFTISKWEQSDIIKKNGINYLKVECKGNTISLYINGEFIKSIKDETHSAGYVGLVGYDNVHVHFDDLKVFVSGTMIKPDYRFDPGRPDTHKDYGSDADALFIDNLSDKSKAWPDDERAHYENGHYTVSGGEKGHFVSQSINETNYIYETSLKIDKWQKNGSAGITFRLNDAGDYYGFFLTEDQSFYLEKCVEGISKSLVLKSPAVFDKDAEQTLRVECKDSEFKLFLNGNELAAALDPDNSLRLNDKFGLYASKGVRADFLSVKLLSIPLSYASVFFTVFTSWCTWATLIVVSLVVMGIRRSRKKKNAELCKKREIEIFDMIRNNQGSLSLGDVMFKYKITKKNAQTMLENIAAEFGGAAVLNPDGSVVYEFPDFMPSEDKIKRDIVAFAVLRKGKITVTDTANFLKMDLTEMEVLMDSMIDGKRVRKMEESGVLFYVFVEIVTDGKKK